MVYATAVRLLSSPAEAEDVAQTVFLKAFERFDDIGASPAAAGWLKTVTTNLCLNHLSRYRSRWRFFSELKPTGGAVADDAGAARSRRRPDGACRSARDRRDRKRTSTPRTNRRASNRHSAGLPDHQRVPIVLFHFESKSYLEIAALLGVTLAKVKTDIHRGREALKERAGIHSCRPMISKTSSIAR